ncbi:MAG: hypothetical protein SPL64_00305 [Bacteroidaceae bacterium]|nr:hypothetical protein [Bacteroidaceae bacterium]
MADTDGTGLKVTFRNAQGQAIARRLNLPVVSGSAGGLLSPELLTKLNASYTKSGTNQTAIETRRLEIAELTERLKGRSQYSNAFTDPQIFLGDFETMEEVNAAIDGMVTEAASPETKFTGHCVVGLLGSRFDIHQYALHFATGDFVQCVSGCVNISADAMGLQQHGQYNIVFRRVSNFTPDIWKGISTLTPNADEMYYGLLDPRDKMKLNNVVDLGNVTTSATAENWAKNPSYLRETQRPTIFQYYDVRNKQCGMIFSLPAGENTFGQTLFLGTNHYKRTVTVSGNTSTATNWIAL